MNDSLILARRTVTKMLRNPEQFLDVTLQPIIMTVLFVFIFGGAVAGNTAGYLPTAEAVENGHPGLATIGFPAPNKNGVWRFPKFSYRRILAKPHPGARRGNPP